MTAQCDFETSGPLEGGDYDFKLFIKVVNPNLKYFRHNLPLKGRYWGTDESSSDTN